MSERLHNDVDPIETRDWLQAIESVIREEGVERAQYLIDQLLSEARKGGVKVAAGASAGWRCLALRNELTTCIMLSFSHQ